MKTSKPPIKPMKHQRVSLTHDEKNDVVFDTSEPGTGKTFVRVLGFAKRYQKYKKKLLVLAPRSLLRAVWGKDFHKFAPQLRVALAYANNRDAAFAQDAEVYVTNHDAAKWLAKKKPVFFKDFNELVIDELPAFKHHTSQRSKALVRIVKHFRFRKGMTGTPNTVSITDVWHQVYILDDGKRLGSSFYAFRNAVCTPVRVGVHENALRWEDKDGAEEAVFGMLGDIVVRHMLDDCADIPKNHHYTVEFELPPKQLQTYNDLQASQLLILGSQKLTAVNASAIGTKLLQISSGAVYTSPDSYTVIDPARYELVMDLAQERVHPLIFFLWKHQRDLLAAEAQRRKLNYAVVDGDASDQYRAEVEVQYQNGLLDGILAHPKTMAHGFTFTRGTSTIWASPTQNLEWYDQGSRRQRRIGQTQKTETIIVLANTEVEQAAYADLKSKNGHMTHFLDLIHTLTKEYK